jgi:hypothetical protein
MYLVRSAPKPPTSFLLVAKETKAKKTTPLRNFSNRLLGRMFFGLVFFYRGQVARFSHFLQGEFNFLTRFARSLLRENFGPFPPRLPRTVESQNLTSFFLTILGGFYDKNQAQRKE